VTKVTPPTDNNNPTTTTTTPAAAEQPPVVPLTPAARAATLLAIVGPFAGVIVGVVLMWDWGFTWSALGLFLGMYLVTGLGITVGYHRLFTHRGFETSGVMKAILAIFGSMAVEGPVLKWVAQHRRHHQHSDQPGDPHSPNLYGGGVIGVLRGLWHAQVGWIFQPDSPQLLGYVGDLRRSRLMRTMSALFPLWILVGMLIPTVLGGVITLSWSGALLGFIWGGLVRVFFVHHVTWSVNSITHLWGTRPFKTTDLSRNNFVVGVLALGEGWHNNHHAFPNSARHGLRWWQFDLSYLVIRGMALVGLARNVRVPSPSDLQARRARAAAAADATGLASS
jgi:stearoyl-CoA desaturase (Delta-9 desaturase)